MENPENILKEDLKDILQIPIDNIIVEPVVETINLLNPEQKIKELEAQLELLKQLQPVVEQPLVEPLVEPVVEPVVEQPIVEPVVEPVVESSVEIVIDNPFIEPVVDKPVEVPKVIHNSDVLYKSNIEWSNNIEYVEPNAYEIEMLHGTKKPHELLEEENKEEIVLKSEEEIKKQRTKDLLLIFKVVSLNRLGYHPIQNTSTFQPMQIKAFLEMMNSIIENEFNQGKEVEITAEFNKICNEKLFANNCDVSQYPVYA